MVALAGTRGTTLQEASASVLSAGCGMSDLRIRGSDVLLFHRVDAREHSRRVSLGAAPLDRIKYQETLLDLPAGVPVPLESLSRRQRTAVRALPHGAVEIDKASVTRHAIRPMRVELAVVRASGWRRGLESAGQFAPFCRRAMLLERPQRSLDEVLMEAGFYGIGVLVPSGAGFEMVVEPEEYRPQRHTAAAWWFVEDVYGRIDWRS